MTDVWTVWLDALTDAARALEGQLSAGEMLDFPLLDPPPLEPGSDGLPPEHLARARQLLDRLESLERVAQTQRDRIAAALRRTAPNRPRGIGARTYELGTALDVAG